MPGYARAVLPALLAVGFFIAAGLLLHGSFDPEFVRAIPITESTGAAPGGDYGELHSSRSSRPVESLTERARILRIFVFVLAALGGLCLCGTIMAVSPRPTPATRDSWAHRTLAEGAEDPNEVGALGSLPAYAWLTLTVIEIAMVVTSAIWWPVPNLFFAFLLLVSVALVCINLSLAGSRRR